MSTAGSDAAVPERPDEAPGIELDELHVAQRCAGPNGERVPAACHVHGVARDAEQPPRPARREDDGARADQARADPVAPHADRSDDAAVVAQQLDDQRVLERMHPRRKHRVAQRQGHVGAAIVNRREHARVAVVPARREVVLPVAHPELRPKRHQLFEPHGRLVGERAHERPLVHPPAAADRVCVVLRGVVLGVEFRGRRGVSASGVRGGAALSELALDRDDHVRARPARAERGSKRGQSAADNEDIGLEGLERHPCAAPTRLTVTRPPRGAIGGTASGPPRRPPSPARFRSSPIRTAAAPAARGACETPCRGRAASDRRAAG